MLLVNYFVDCGRKETRDKGKGNVARPKAYRFSVTRRKWLIEQQGEKLRLLGGRFCTSCSYCCFESTMVIPKIRRRFTWTLSCFWFLWCVTTAIAWGGFGSRGHCIRPAKKWSPSTLCPLRRRDPSRERGASLYRWNNKRSIVTSRILSSFPLLFSGHASQQWNSMESGNQSPCKPLPFHPPVLAIVTEPDACHSEARLNQTLNAIKQALGSGPGVQLISIRLTKPELSRDVEEGDGDGDGGGGDDILEGMQYQERVRRLCSGIRHIVTNYNDKVDDSSARQILCRVVINMNDINTDLDIALKCKLDGVHAKERDRELIPDVKKLWQSHQAEQGHPCTPPLVGTSAHSVDSAVDAAVKHDIDYLFVGTCFVTQTHPEKAAEDLEGPALPGKIRLALQDRGYSTPCLAIGGINENNCAVPIQLGANGETVIIRP
jgi:hypothetical protein